MLKEITGALTGDRRTQAHGRAEEAAAAQDTAVTDDDRRRALDDVRKQHGDIPPHE